LLLIILKFYIELKSVPVLHLDISTKKHEDLHIMSYQMDQMSYELNEKNKKIKFLEEQIKISNDEVKYLLLNIENEIN
jgi:hypothetical protein